MPLPLSEGLAEIRPLLLDPHRLVRAIAAGHTRGGRPDPARVQLRVVQLRGEKCLQLASWALGQDPALAPVTRNVRPGDETEQAIDDLLAQPFGNWHVETVEKTVQLRVTKRGQAQVHSTATSRRLVQPTAHDRPAQHLLDPGDPFFTVLGARADKRRQVDAFLRQLEQVVAVAQRQAAAQGRALRVVDLGCGNAYLTFAAHKWLTSREGAETPVRTVGIDRRPDQVLRNTELAHRLGFSPPPGEEDASSLTFVSGSIADSDPGFDDGPQAASPSGSPTGRVDLVLALHACDTATDEALAQAVRWEAQAVLAAPCCHHDLQRQLTSTTAHSCGHSAEKDRGPACRALLRHAILRERFADVLTDTMRSELLTLLGYRTAVVEFVDSRHTPRNALIRAVRTGGRIDPQHRREYQDLLDQWSVEPALARLLPDLLEPLLATDRTALVPQDARDLQ